jgi:biopolymer transport protein ExbD
MRFTVNKRRRVPSVIIVSLIDVLLVVLIFLMISTTTKRVEPALKLNLPESKEAKPGAAEEKPFVIMVATNFPYFYMANKAVTLDQLQRALAAAAKRDPKLKVAIKADKHAPFGEIVRLIDASKLAQVGSINFITEKSGKP